MIDPKEIKQLLKIMNENDLIEISVKNGEDSISLKKAGVIQQMPVIQANVSEVKAKEESAKPQRANNIKEITSPMVGTFYRSPSPDAVPYVEVGSSIKNGTALCIVEAMKLMNEVKSEISGKIIEILVENAQPVEFGQVLFLVEV